MRKRKQAIISMLVGGYCAAGAAVWMMNEPMSLRVVLVATLVGCAVVCLVYSVYLVLELCHE